MERIPLDTSDSQTGGEYYTINEDEQAIDQSSIGSPFSV